MYSKIPRSTKVGVRFKAVRMEFGLFLFIICRRSSKAEVDLFIPMSVPRLRQGSRVSDLLLN